MLPPRPDARQTSYDTAKRLIRTRRKGKPINPDRIVAHLQKHLEEQEGQKCST